MDTNIQARRIPAVSGAIMVSGTELKKLRVCDQSYYYSKLHLDCDQSYYYSKLHLDHLDVEDFESTHFLREAVRYAVKLLKDGETDCERKIEAFFKKGYLSEWYGTNAEYEAEYRKDLYKVKRFVKFIEENGYCVRSCALPYEAEFNNHPMQFKGYAIKGLKGEYDIVLEKGSELFLVNVYTGKPEYTLKARKVERKPENSLELLVAQLGGYTVFEEKYHTQLWYLGNLDDSGNNMPSFEHRKGKNIITSKVLDEMTSSEVFTHFLKLIKEDVRADCSSCFYQDVCKKPELRQVENSEEVREHKEKKFTDAQLEVVEHVNGPLCCIAVPGAGKTTALVERMVRLVKKGVRPDKILMLTFTKKAAKEITERVSAVLHGKVQPVISTYNSLGFSILKENPIYVGGKRLKLADDVDRYKLIYDAIRQSPVILGVSYAYISGEHGLIRSLDSMFAEIEDKGKEAFSNQYGERKDVEGIFKVYDLYNKAYKDKGYISYDDQIGMVNELFDTYQELLHRYSERYEYIMVDEFQDTSEDQAEMIYTLARAHNNLVVVGDDDQSIYKWRGGSPDYMLNFRKDFPDAKLVYMEDNFRSNGKILQLADALIQGSGERYEKQLHSHIDGDIKPIYFKGVPSDLVNIVSSAVNHGVKPGDISILARNNKRLKEVQMLLGEKFPVAVPKDYMIEDAGFIVLHDILSLYYKGMDCDVAFYRVMCYLEAENDLIRKQGKESLYNAMIRTNTLMPVEKTSECMEAYYAKAKESKSMAAGYTLLKCFERIAYGNLRDVVTDIIGMVFNVSEHRIIEAIVDTAEDRGITKTKDLFELMEDMVKYNVQSRVGYDVSTQAINLLTCHDSKGKEFHTVIVYGMEEFEENSDMQEGIRVLYVAITRAEQNLYLLENAAPRHNGIFSKISPYVQVIGDRL